MALSNANIAETPSNAEIHDGVESSSMAGKNGLEDDLPATFALLSSRAAGEREQNFNTDMQYAEIFMKKVLQLR